MAGIVTMAGLGSGIDVEGLIAGLVKAEQVTMNRLTSKATSFRTAASTLSDIGTALSALQTAASGLSSTTGVGSMTASSTSASVVASASGAALPASYTVTVDRLASEQRTYSKTFGSTSGALGLAEDFTLRVGSGTIATVHVLAGDSLDQVAGKINQAGLRVSASVFYDGASYRLQVRGMDTGDANALTFGSETLLDLNGDGSSPIGGKTVQEAKNSALTIDGFDVSGSTNLIAGAIPGVTLALTAKTTGPATVAVGSDPAALQAKASGLVNAFNTVIKAARGAAGYGGIAASVDALAGDSALRTVAKRLSGAITSQVVTTGPYKSMQDIGISLDRNGLLTVDNTKLSKALAADAGSVVNLLARPAGATTGGLMANLADAVTAITDPFNGALTLRNQSFTSQAKKFDSRAASEQARVDQYADRLRKSLGTMDAQMGADKVTQQAFTNTFASLYK